MAFSARFFCLMAYIPTPTRLITSKPQPVPMPTTTAVLIEFLPDPSETYLRNSY